MKDRELLALMAATIASQDKRVQTADYEPVTFRSVALAERILVEVTRRTWAAGNRSVGSAPNA